MAMNPSRGFDKFCRIAKFERAKHGPKGEPTRRGRIIPNQSHPPSRRTRYGMIIGNGAIIGANAFVVKDVSDYAIVAGNPAKIVKMHFDEKNISRLLQIAWWNWNIEKINAKLPAICSLDIETLDDD